MSLWSLVLHAESEAPDRVMLADDHGRTLTTTQFRRAAEAVAAALPVEGGATVSWQLPTVLEAPVLMAALSRLGVRQNPLMPVLRDREVRSITTQVHTDLLVVPHTWRGFAHGDMARSLGVTVVELELEGPIDAHLRLPVADPAGLPPAPSADAEWVYFSSGTTAEPKGVRHTDVSLIASANAMIERSGFGDGDVYPIAWPFAHIGGISMLVCAMRRQMQLVLFDSFDPATIAERMATHRPTILGSAQPFFRAYLDAQLAHGAQPLFPDVRAFTAGGAPTPPEMVREIAEVFGLPGVQQAYGLTEFPIATAAEPDDPPEVMLHSVGRPPSGVEIRIVDGEIRLRGPQCFAGYVDASLDADAFDDEGWVRTGDLGSIDDQGRLHVTGRLKDVIIRNAENISALEIEDVLLRHPAIVDVAVIGLPDARTGERVCALLVTDGSPLDVDAVAEHCIAEGLARFKCPEQVELVDQLERNGMGKLVKQAIRAKVMG